jgi:hypothetical protein
MIFQAGNLEFLRTDSSRKLSTGGEDAADCDAGGLTLDQNANDAKILTMKSSDVAHGITNNAETDTYAEFSKASSGSGGLLIETFMETTSSFILNAHHTTENTTQARTGFDSAIRLNTVLKSGTGGTSHGASANILSVEDDSTARVLFTGDGDVFSDRTFSDSAFDHYDDAHLVRAYDLSHGKGVIDSKFDKFVQYNAQKLADLNIIGKEVDGTPSTFVNINGLQRLHNGAIWQQYEKHQKLANAMYELAKAAVGEDKANEILEQNDIKLLN